MQNYLWDLGYYDMHFVQLHRSYTYNIKSSLYNSNSIVAKENYKATQDYKGIQSYSVAGQEPFYPQSRNYTGQCIAC